MGGTSAARENATSVPDCGVFVEEYVNAPREEKTVLSRDSRMLCVDPGTTRTYVTNDNKLPTTCPGGFAPLTSAYYFLS